MVLSDLYIAVLIYQNIRVISDGKQLRFENLVAQLPNMGDIPDYGAISPFHVHLYATNNKDRPTPGDILVEIVPQLISKMTMGDSGEVIYYPLIFLNYDRQVVYSKRYLGTQTSLEAGVTIDFNDDFFPEGRNLCGEWKKLMKWVYDPRDPGPSTPSCTGKYGVTTTYDGRKAITGGGGKGAGGKKGAGDGKKGGNGKKNGNGADKKGVGDRKMNKFLIVLAVAVVISLILILLYFVFRKNNREKSLDRRAVFIK